MHVRKVAVIFIYLVAAIVSLVFADKESNKRMPPSNAHAFQQMVRYGRASSKDKINVYPRADVFYLGPRYGKRSRTTPPQRDSLEMSNEINDRTIPCTYTGVSNLYRCNTYKRSTIKEHRI
ncbi:unnamed protein product [Ceutorhynchus assimilis]|uniref:RYamide n=1 Tax=Ceutorhynchus assimilis TaxID=467358 RepID=A0A9N9MKQ4_9CUCU|nr:unnamed protein product [Ceutorhynchus assimilis]